MKLVSTLALSGLMSLGFNATEAQMQIQQKSAKHTSEILTLSPSECTSAGTTKTISPQLQDKYIGRNKTYGYIGNLVDEQGRCMLDIPREELKPIIQKHIEHILTTIDMDINGGSIENTSLGDWSIKKERRENGDYYVYVLTINGHRYEIETPITLKSFSKRRNSEKQQVEFVLEVNVFGEQIFTPSEIAAKVVAAFLNTQDRLNSKQLNSKTPPENRIIIYQKVITFAEFKYLNYEGK